MRDEGGEEVGEGVDVGGWGGGEDGVQGVGTAGFGVGGGGGGPVHC